MKGRHNNRGNFNSYNILPAARILEEYETTSSGSVNKLLEMAKKEQEHRHSWQDRYLTSHNFAYRTGQLFGFVYNLLLLYLVFKLIKNGEINTAIKIFVSNTLLIALAILITFTERKITTRKPPRRGGNQGPSENNRTPHQPRRPHNNSGQNVNRDSANRDNTNRGERSERGERGGRDGNRTHNRPTRGDKDGY
jgi:uncharacterized membrane protein